jgi:SSS family solute:Na+ symporter
MLILLAIGFWSAKKISEISDFLLAGRRLGTLLAAGALAATHFGGGMIMGGGEYGFIYGLSGAWYGIACGLGLIILALLTASEFRKLAFYTVPDYLEHRYNSKFLRVLSALLSLTALTGILAAQVLASQGALSIIGFKGNSGAIISTIVFIVYTVSGGLWAATITDFFQMIIAGGGVIIAAIFIIRGTGGFEGMLDMINQGGIVVSSKYLSIFGMASTTIMWLLIPTIMYTLIGQDFYQRLFSTKDAKTAKTASIVGGIFLIIISLFPAIIGMGAKAYFPELVDSKMAVSKIVKEFFPDWLGAIVLAALLSAIMSTASSLLTAGVSHVIKDFWIEIFNRQSIEKLSTKKLLFISRVLTVILGLFALIIALSIPVIIDVLIYSYTIYTAGVFIPVIGGVLWRKATTAGALTGLIAGGLIALTGIITKIYIAGIPVEIYAAGASLVVFIVVSLFTEKTKYE